ncbi:hypothetical protein ABPG75_002089 [Micractinium tetrahymenae]
MTAHSLGCVPNSDEEGPDLPARLGPRQTALAECESIVSDEEDAARPWQGSHYAAAATAAPQQGWEEEVANGALRQLNAQLPPPPSSQHFQGATQPKGKGFIRRAVPAAAKPTAASGTSARSAMRPSFRRSMKTTEAAQAARAAAERADAEATELAVALAAAGPAQAAEECEEAHGRRDLQGSLAAKPWQQQQQQKTLADLTNQEAAQVALPAALPAGAPAAQWPASHAGGPSFLNRKVLPRAPSWAEEPRQQAERAGPSAGAPVAAVPAATAGGEAAAAMGMQRSESTRPRSQLREQQSTDVPPAAGGAVAAVPPSRSATAQPAAAGQASGAAAAAATAAAPPTATFHRTADGLNVIFLNRQQPAAAAADVAGGKGAGRPSKGKAESVNGGWGNNFVKMDLKKGRGSTKYSTKHGGKRRKKAGRFSSRWQTSRLRQVGDGADYLEGWQASKLRCFKCGGSGHFARDCTAEQQAQADMGALLDSSDDDGQPGSGSEGGPGGAARRPGSSAAAAAAAALPLSQRVSGTLRAMSAASLPPPALPAADPAEQFASVLAEPDEAALTGVLRQVFGHPAFRGLQLPTVQRLLGGESLLSIMPTGMGKSLCYQLPALLLPGLTLVVSPLIALMHDQAASVPPPLTAAVLWSGQTRADALQVLGDVAAGRIKVLFVSPERLGNPHLLEALRPRMPLPLVVVDEAHCVAEWGHSFRPAYFRLGAALAGSVRAQRILALTATATRATEAAIRQVLRIAEGSVLRDAAVRQNLRLQVLRTSGGGSSQATRERICSLFAPGGPLGGVRSAIVYVAFKEDANQLARLLGVRGVSARAYHAGKDYRERAAVEADFAAGRARVVVATVAFGMGINLAGVGAVVHATMPRSLEEYVQQIGRAGRDGSEARCVAMLDDGDFTRLRSLAYSGVLDLPAVRDFLAAVFSPAAEGERISRRSAKDKAAAAAKPAATAAGSRSKGRKRKGEAAEAVAADSRRSSRRKGPAEAAEAAQAGQEDDLGAAAESEAEAEAAAGSDGEAGAAAEAEAQPVRRRFGVLAVKKLADELDMREESMETVLSYLEAEEAPCLRMLPTAALSVKVSFYAAAPEALAGHHPVVQHVLEACPHPRNGVYSAPAAKLAAAAQKAPGLVLQELRELAAGGLVGFELSREEGPAYEILHTPPDLDGLAHQIHSRLEAVLACQVSRLDTSYRALATAVAAGTAAGQAGKGSDAAAEAQEAALREAVQQYFEEEQGGKAPGSAAAAEGAAAGEGGSAGAAPASGSAAAPASSGAAGSRGASTLLLDTAGLPLRPTTPALLTAARAALRSNREQAGPALSGRALARILHGVGSPAFPPDAWQKRMGAFWGSQQLVDFGAVLRAAEIVVRGEVGGRTGGGGSAGVAGEDSE